MDCIMTSCIKIKWRPYRCRTKKKTLNKVRSGDIIVVRKLDRFARNAREALEIIEPLLGQSMC